MVITPNQTNDLRQIVTQLSVTITEQDARIAEMTARLGDLQSELGSIRNNQANYSSDRATTQAEVSRLRAAVTQASTDAALAAGTSIAAQKQQELAAVREQLARAEAQLGTLQESFSHDSQAEQDTMASILEMQNQLAALQIERSGVMASRERWSRDLCSAIKAQEAEMLDAGRAEIERLTAALSEAYSTYDQGLRQAARNLQSWERDALDLLAEYGRWDDNPPTVIVAQAQLAEAEAARDAAQRTRVQSGDSIVPTIQGYHRQVLDLSARIETLRQQHRQDAALKLLRELQGVKATMTPTVVVEVEMAAQPRPRPQGVTTQTGFGSETMHIIGGN